MEASARLNKKTTHVHLRPAIALLGELLRQHVELLPEAKVVVWLYDRQDAKAVRLAEGFPAETKGFGGEAKKIEMTVREFLELGSPRNQAVFWGELREGLGVKGELDLMEETLAKGQGRIEVMVSKVRWHGSPEAWTGSAGIEGTGVAGSAFMLHLHLGSASVMSRAGMEEVMQAVKETTGLDFRGGKSALPTQKRTSGCPIWKPNVPSHCVPGRRFTRHGRKLCGWGIGGRTSPVRCCH